MRAVALGLLAAGLATAAQPPTPKKGPDWSGYLAVEGKLAAVVKEVGEETLTVTVPGATLVKFSGTLKRPRATSSAGKPEEVTLTFHEFAVVRWAKEPPKVDAKGKKVPRTLKEMEALRLPKWATGFAADRADLAEKQVVELTLLRPKNIPVEKVTAADLRVKQATILSDPPWPGTAAKKDGEKKEAKKK